MIAFDLCCSRGHKFEGWFKDSASFEEQRTSGKIDCPICNDRQIERAFSPFTIEKDGGKKIVSILGMVLGMPQATAIARQGEETARNAAAAPADVIIARRGWESQLAAPVLLGAKTLYEAPGDPRPLVEALVARGTRSFAVIDRRPVTLRLSHGRSARTVGSTAGWLHFQHVVIEDPRAR